MPRPQLWIFMYVHFFVRLQHWTVLLQTSMTKDVVLSPLAQADGSASYTSNGYSVIAAVNGPVEVQRRDEIPEASAIDVVLRPAVGVGGKNIELFKRRTPSMLTCFSRSTGKTSGIHYRKDTATSDPCLGASTYTNSGYAASRCCTRR